MAPEPQVFPPYARLNEFLKEANYDAALALVDSWDLRAIVKAPSDPLHRLRFVCMISDVLDYGGRYSEAERNIHEVGTNAEQRLFAIRSGNDIIDPPYQKQECWALMMWGMSFYRSFDYKRAGKLFYRAKDVVQMIHSSRVISCIGTLARAWYCIGLVEREKHEYRAARTAFRHSIEFAGKGIEHRKDEKATVSFDFHMARCNGLGVGWIAYNEAQLTEATGALVVARSRMMSKRAKFISAYIDLVQASIIMSESTSLDRIDEAIGLLNSAHDRFAPAHGIQHTPYTLRAENEVALAFLRRARRAPSDEREDNLREAERYLERVKTVARPLKTETKAHCTALITEARICRERGNYPKSLTVAEHAKALGGHMRFTLIDASIAIGEAAFYLGSYPAAIDAFEQALDEGKASRKVAAVCYLHLCRAYLANNQPSNAMENFKLWEVTESSLENAFITDLAATVRKSLSHTFQDFVRTKNDLKPGCRRTIFADLRMWLAETALALENDDPDRAAKRLGMTVANLRLWLKGGAERAAPED